MLNIKQQNSQNVTQNSSKQHKALFHPVRKTKLSLDVEQQVQKDIIMGKIIITPSPNKITLKTQHPQPDPRQQLINQIKQNKSKLYELLQKVNQQEQALLRIKQQKSKRQMVKSIHTKEQIDAIRSILKQKIKSEMIKKQKSQLLQKQIYTQIVAQRSTEQKKLEQLREMRKSKAIRQIERLKESKQKASLNSLTKKKALLQKRQYTFEINRSEDRKRQIFQEQRKMTILKEMRQKNRTDFQDIKHHQISYLKTRKQLQEDKRKKRMLTQAAHCSHQSISDLNSSADQSLQGKNLQSINYPTTIFSQIIKKQSQLRRSQIKKLKQEPKQKLNKIIQFSKMVEKNHRPKLKKQKSQGLLKEKDNDKRIAKSQKQIRQLGHLYLKKARKLKKRKIQLDFSLPFEKNQGTQWLSYLKKQGKHSQLERALQFLMSPLKDKNKAKNGQIGKEEDILCDAIKCKLEVLRALK